MSQGTAASYCTAGTLARFRLGAGGSGIVVTERSGGFCFIAIATRTCSFMCCLGSTGGCFRDFPGSVRMAERRDAVAGKIGTTGRTSPHSLSCGGTGCCLDCCPSLRGRGMAACRQGCRDRGDHHQGEHRQENEFLLHSVSNPPFA